MSHPAIMMSRRIFSPKYMATKDVFSFLQNSLSVCTLTLCGIHMIVKARSGPCQIYAFQRNKILLS